MKKRTKKLLFLWCLTISVPATGQTVVLKAPERNFGYLVGDVIVTEAVITTRAENRIDSRSVPVPGPLTSSIELRRVDMHENSSNGQRQTVLRMEYQNFFAPEQVMQAELPAYDIRFASLVAHVPAWPFHVSPLRVARRSVDDVTDLRGNRDVPPLSDLPTLAGLLASAGLACGSAIVFAGMRGWLPGFGRKPKYFALAARNIGRLAPPETERAMRALLHAFDATDGRHVFAEDVESFLLRHPTFSILRSDIQRFFDRTRHVFFAPSRAATQTREDFAEVVSLARALRRAERRW